MSRRKGQKKWKERHITLDAEAEMIGLYHTINFLLPEAEAKIIQFIGSLPGEGTSTISKAFARVAAVQLNKSVLLFTDVGLPDRSTPSTSLQPRALGWHMGDGDAIVEAAYELVESRLFVYPIALLGAPLSTVFSSPHIGGLFDKLKQHFDLILLDSPPATLSADGIAAVRQVDGVVLVVEADYTRAPVVQQVKNRILKAGGKILGVVLNKRRYYIPPLIYKRL